jgi:hypothetical protein
MGLFYNDFQSKDELITPPSRTLSTPSPPGSTSSPSALTPPRPSPELPAHRTPAHREPELSKVLLHNAGRLDRGSRHARVATRMPPSTPDGSASAIELSLAIIAGATLCLGQLLHDHRYPIWATFHNTALPRQLPDWPDLPDRSDAQRSMARRRCGNLLESVFFGRAHLPRRRRRAGCARCSTAAHRADRGTPARRDGLGSE